MSNNEKTTEQELLRQRLFAATKAEMEFEQDKEILEEMGQRVHSDVPEQEPPSDTQQALNAAAIGTLRKLLDGLEDGTLTAMDVYQTQDFVTIYEAGGDKMSFEASATGSLRVGFVNLERKAALIQKGLPYLGSQIVER
jgi:predicted regulator of Ras-like GTPase activity (Roadblock/LC7/MglB family)